ncbi:type II toxin-antitoxin system RelE family toxin [Pyxidicoccus sp. 3LFB2]
MQPPRNIHRPYTVEIEADAWGQVSRLPRDTYRTIQARLESLAALSSQATPASPGDAVDEASSFRLGDLTIRYAVDARRRLILLLGIARERSTASTASRTRGEESPG